MNRAVVDVDTIDPKMSETKSLCNSESQRVFVDHVVTSRALGVHELVFLSCLSPCVLLLRDIKVRQLCHIAWKNIF